MWSRQVVLLTLASILASAPLSAQRPPGDADNVILITLDGARVQELFGGLDLEILRSTLKQGQRAEDQPVYRRFWAESPQARREKLMPFFWRTLMSAHGSIAGNRLLGSEVHLTNRHRFSYPGYSEILVGEAHDDAIKSNDPIRNPNRTVLEIVRERLGLPVERVATVASWAHFNAIAEHTEGATFINAGQETLAGTAGPRAVERVAARGRAAVERRAIRCVHVRSGDGPSGRGASAAALSVVRRDR